jgi:hypothetical protein
MTNHFGVKMANDLQMVAKELACTRRSCEVVIQD